MFAGSHYNCGKCCKHFPMDLDTKEKPMKGRDTVKSVQKRIIQAIMVILYFALPLVPERIFDAVKCRTFKVDNQEPPVFISYL